MHVYQSTSSGISSNRERTLYNSTFSFRSFYPMFPCKTLTPGHIFLSAVKPPLTMKTVMSTRLARAVFGSICTWFTLTGVVSSQPYNNCDVASYYSPMSDLARRSDLHTHVRDTHRTSLPCTSSRDPDVWDALAALDADPTGAAVLLVYADRDAPAAPHDDGSCERWNREHLWPRSRGVGETGPDHTDLHHLRPADCNVNAARGNLPFGACATFPDEACTSPAHAEAASDTQKNGVSFLPPADQRGDVARAILYMDLRYDGGDESNVENLHVTDCPEGHAGEMGYLSELLRWHAEDPPDEREKTRNDAVCTSE